MATDATGSPTPLGIPKYNTSGDAPSGLGFNAAMDSIDALITARVAKPVGIASGEAMVWNGTSFDRSTVTKIGPASLSGLALYRKVTAKQVVNTVTETDLLNGEITIAAGLVGASGRLRLTAEGDFTNTSGGPVSQPRLKLKLGATTLLDSSSAAAAITSSAGRFGWRVICEIQNESATNVQWATMDGHYGSGGASVATNFATGEGVHVTALIAGGVAITTLLGGGAGAVDTTASNVLALTVTLGTASAGHDFTLKSAVVEVV